MNETTKRELTRIAREIARFAIVGADELRDDVTDRTFESVACNQLEQFFDDVSQSRELAELARRELNAMLKRMRRDDDNTDEVYSRR